jgi:hypothetical protein
VDEDLLRGLVVGGVGGSFDQIAVVKRACAEFDVAPAAGTRRSACGGLSISLASTFLSM